MTPTDDLGASVELASLANWPARRVVSLVPSLTEAIAISRPEILIAATDWCTHPAELDVVRVRGTKNPDLRRIVQLAPDLVVCNQEENRELDVRRLRAAGIAVWVTRIQTLAEAFVSMRRLFTEALAGEVPEWLVAAEHAWQPPGTCELSAATAIWRDPWMVVGSDTFTGDLLARLGVGNVFGRSEQRYPSTTPAEILVASPDVVLLPDEPYVFTANDGPEAFPGQRSVLVSGRLLTWYGPSLVTARAALETALNP